MAGRNCILFTDKTSRLGLTKIFGVFWVIHTVRQQRQIREHKKENIPLGKCLLGACDRPETLLVARDRVSQPDRGCPQRPKCVRKAQSLGAQSVTHLPSAQIRILGSWDGASCWVPGSPGSLLLPLLATCALHHHLCFSNK